MKYLFNENDFRIFLKRYENASFSNDKKSIIETALNQSLFTSQQAKLILSNISFENDKKELICKLYNNLIDPQNYEELLDTLSFSKDEIRKWIQSTPIPNNNFNNNCNNFNNNNDQNTNFDNYNNDNNFNNNNNNNFNNNNNNNFNYNNNNNFNNNNNNNFNNNNNNNFNNNNNNNNSFNNNNNNNFNNSNNNAVNHQILNETAFKKNLALFKNESFFSTQLPIFENILKFYFLNCNQAVQFIKILSFGNDKIKAFVIVYPYLTDPQNYEKILDAMTFDSEKNTARSLINSLPSYYVPIQNNNFNGNFNNNSNGNFNNNFNGDY
jgi:hypothetical protein